MDANKDGQPEYLTGDLYAKHFKVFADSMKKSSCSNWKTIYVGAVMQESQTQSWQTTTTQTWNSTMIPEANNVPDFYRSNYITPYGENSNASTVLNSALTVPGQMISFMKSEIERNNRTVKPIILSEWNMWTKIRNSRFSNASGTFAVIVQAEALKK